MTYKYTVGCIDLSIYKYIEDDEFVREFLCFEDFKDAKQCLLEELDKKVKWALSINSRNYNK